MNKIVLVVGLVASVVFAESITVSPNEKLSNINEFDLPKTKAQPREVTNGTCGDDCYWVLYDEKYLYINGSGPMKDFYEDGPWGQYCESAYITGVTHIGDNAFYQNWWLKEVVISNSVTSIGKGALAACPKLKKLTIPKTVTYAGNQAFRSNNLGFFCYLGTVDAAGGSVLVFFDSDLGVLVTENYTKSTFGGNKVYHDERCIVRESGTCGSDCSWRLDVESGDLTIWGSGAMDNYSSDNRPWQNDRIDIKSVTITGITSIGSYAFSDCTSLTSIAISDSVTSIGEAAFNHCRLLSSITIPAYVTSIGSKAFSTCRSLSHFCYLGITNPGQSSTNVFESCSELSSVSVGQKYRDTKFCGKSISKDGTCVGLLSGTCGSKCSWSLNLDTDVLFISGSGGMDDYSSVIKPWESYLTNIKYITLDGITYIPPDTFSDCSLLEYINVTSNTAQYSSIDGVLFNSNKRTLIQYPIGSSSTSYDIPNTVTKIGNFAFKNCRSLSSVTIPRYVTSVGISAFYNCSSLSNVCYLGTSDPGVPYDSAFDLCSKLSSVSVGQKYRDNNFCGTSFSKDGTCFEVINGTCGINCFWTQNLDTDVLFISGSGPMDNFSQFGAPWRSEGASVKYITMDGITSIGDQAFYSFTSLESITIPDYVTYIGSKAFVECKALKSISIPESVTTLSNNAFNNCDSLEYINVDPGNSVYSSVDGVVFDKDKKTLIRYPKRKPDKSYETPKTVTSIGKYSFYGCSKLASITISNSVTSIESHAFESCEVAKSITIGNSVTSIGESAFRGCLSLEFLIIPASVTYIGSYAINHCEMLMHVCYLGTTDPGKNSENVLLESYDLSYVSVTGEYTDTRFCGKIISKDGTCARVMNGTCGSSCSWTLDFETGNLSIYGSGAMDDYIVFDEPWYKVKTSIKYVTLDGITYIGGKAFSDCVFLEYVSIPESVTSIGLDAFQCCSNLNSITIPSSVTSIGSFAFGECGNLVLTYLGSSDPGNESEGVFDRTDIVICVTPEYADSSFCGESERMSICIDSSDSTSSHTPVASASSVKSSSHTPVASASSVKSSSSAPFTCSDDEYVSGNVCKKCSDAIVACRKCSDGVTCKECYNGYIVKEGKCVLDCTSFGEGCNQCSSKACLNCTGTECCSKKEYYWDGNNCVHPSSKFGEGCLKTDGVKCTKCTAPGCCAKKEFYDYSQSTCSACPENCAKCSAAGCLQCDEGMITDATGACLTCSDIYGVGCSKCGKNGCTETEVGDPNDPYCIVAGMCKRVSEAYGASCAKYSNNMCTECKDSTPKTVLVDGFCKKCSAVFGSDCTDCSSSACTQCSSLKLLNGVCAGPAEAFGEGCAAFDANKEKCGTAKSGYFVDGLSGYAMSCQALLDEDLKNQCNNPSRRRSIKTVIRDDGIRVMFNGQNCTADPTLIDPNCELWEDSCKKCYSGSTLYGGVCKPCTELFGDTCTECTLTSCTACSEGVAFHGSCVNCNDFIPSCTECSSVDVCTECGDNLQVKDGVCVDCQVKYGEGCQECNATKCKTCTADDCCGENEWIIKSGDALQCGTCSVLTENCVNCTSTECLGCAEGMAVDEDGSCVQCSNLFIGCGKCNSEECTACTEEGWIMTPNGCYHENIPVPSSSSRTEPPKIEQSSTLISVKSASEGGSNAGMIAGIVIGVLAAVAIAAVTIYCVVTYALKRDKVDSSTSEDKNAVSMSTL